MIQEALRDLLAEAIPDLTWTVDYRTARDNTGTVYSTGGFSPDEYESDFLYPTYQVYIRSGDWDYAKFASYIAFHELHKKRDFWATVKFEKNRRVYLTTYYYVYQILATSDPIRIGEVDGIMEYSLNFDVTMKEDSSYGA